MGGSSSIPAPAGSSLTEEIQSECIVVFSMLRCTYCDKAKQVLASMGAQYKAVELDFKSKEGNDLVKDLSARTGMRTVCLFLKLLINCFPRG